MILATTGVRATVGGNRTGDSALCAAYAMAKVPTFSLVSEGFSPTRCSKEGTSTPAMNGRTSEQGHNGEEQQSMDVCELAKSASPYALEQNAGMIG